MGGSLSGRRKIVPVYAPRTDVPHPPINSSMRERMAKNPFSHVLFMGPERVVERIVEVPRDSWYDRLWAWLKHIFMNVFGR